MLPHHQKTIQATVPVLREYGEKITSVFYRQMFEAHPELLNIFNPANQRNGGQARSLAASILAYAAHIDHLDKLGGMVEQIAQKHVSLEIAPEHYPIVGQHLLGAIKTVLGEAATHEIIEAWAAAYQQLAEIMIGREAELYDKGASEPGGWRGYKPFVVTRKHKESDVITSFYLSPADGVPLPPFKPGQFLSVKVRVPGAQFDQIRQYSRSEVANGKYYRVSVKRETAPEASVPHGQVSNHLHDEIAEGDTLNVHMPAGHFTMSESESPVVLISGGVGITPALCMLQHLAREGRRDVLFVHAALKGSHHAFRDELRVLAAQHPRVRSIIYYEQPQRDDVLGKDYDYEGRISAESLRRHLPAGEAEYYFCGSIGFMNALNGILDSLSVPAAQRYSEAFAPDPSFDQELARAEDSQPSPVG